MMGRCEWCDSDKIQHTKTSVYWELPDGTRAIEISETPAVKCSSCEMEYQTESLVKELEDQLFLINTKNLPSCISYEQLMKEPRLLKRNYFDFSS